MTAGPYATEAQAAAEPMPREVAEAFAAGLFESAPSIRFGALLDACEAAGVAPDLYDREVFSWLAKWESTTAQVVIGLIERAAGTPVPSLDEAPVGACAWIPGESGVGIRDLYVVRISASRRPDAKVWAEVDGDETARWTSATLTEHDAEITYVPRKVAR